MTHHRSLHRRQWTWPIALATLTIFGLLSALLGDGGAWWGLSWTALTIPILVILRHVLLPRNRGNPRAR